MLPQPLKIQSVSLLVADKSMWGICLLSMTAFSGHFFAISLWTFHPSLYFLLKVIHAPFSVREKPWRSDLLTELSPYISKNCLNTSVPHRTTTDTDLSFAWNMSPYLSLSFVTIICVSFPSCSKFPVIGQGAGPRSLFILFLPVTCQFIATDTCKYK